MALFRMYRQRGTRVARRPRGLRLETLETRTLMAGLAINVPLPQAGPSVTLDNQTGAIVIQGTDRNDHAEVRLDSRGTADPLDDQVVVSVNNGGPSVEHRFFRFVPGTSTLLVQSIQFDGLGGNDGFFNHTGFRSRVNGGAGQDILRGGVNDDTLIGGSDDDILDGGGGHDLLVGGQGRDIISGANGNDVIYGDGGNDLLTGGAGDDVILGGVGDDEIHGNGGFDMLYGDAGDDNLDGGDENDTVSGGDGDDHVYGDAGHDTLHGDGGDDYLYGGLHNDLIFGGQGFDLLHGNAGDDYLYGGGDNDSLLGDAGNDHLYGHAGHDFLFGGDDNDVLYGGAGDDQMFGGNGTDVLYGEAGNDILSGGYVDVRDDFAATGLFGYAAFSDGEKDYLYGGAGIDEFYKADKKFWFYWLDEVLDATSGEEVHAKGWWPFTFESYGLPTPVGHANKPD